MKNNYPLFEDIIYIEFFLLGNFIFSCQKSWFSNKSDIWDKIFDLADQYQVSIESIIVKEVVVKVPIYLPDNYMKKLVGELGISFESEDLNNLF